jgi:hypothetical protein
VSPADLALETVRDQRGGLFQEAYATWERAVTAYQQVHPSWSPTKRPTPGIDPVEEDRSDARYLASWLATRDREFPGWGATYGQGVAWDFSSGSLSALGELVLRLTPTLAELHDPANAAFVDGAAWYVGETLRRVKGGRWYYQHGDPDTEVYTGYPYVRQLDPDDNATVPMRALRLLVKRGDRDHLRQRYERFAT